MTPLKFLRSAKIVGLKQGQMFGLVGLGLATTLFEAAGVMMMLPALEFIQAKGELSATVLQSTRWRVLDDVFAFAGVKISLGGLLTIAFVAILLRQTLQYAQRIYTSRVRNGLIIGLRSKLFSGILAADLGSIEREASGALLNDFTTESEVAVTSLMFFLQIVITAGICVIYLGALVLLSPTMTALSVTLMLITGLAVRGMLHKTLAIGLATTEANQQIGTFLVERLKALRLIRLSGTETAEREHAWALMNELSLQRIAADSVGAQLGSTVEPLFIGFAFFCLWFGSSYVGLDLGSLSIFLVIVLRLVPIGKDLLGSRQIVLQTKASLDCIETRLGKLDSARENDVGLRPFANVDKAIRFEGVHFSHSAGGHDVVALKGLSVEIPARKTTAIVGPSGGGKSTLIDLLPSLRQAQAGRILIDGEPIDQFARKSLRNGISFVPQAPQIFDVTAAAHIGYGRPGATRDDIETAARRANAFGFISQLPNGFDTRLGEGGSRLSGGQRQRLDLARALARGAPILVLDEPTSALDAESEHAFQQALEAIRREGNTTIVVIAHRLSTIANSDLIVVIESGRVTDRGTHDALLARGGWYARSWATQTQEIRMASEPFADVVQ